MDDLAQTGRVQRLHDWFALQLHFAEVFASRKRIALGEAVTFYTNFHRRFGFGRPATDRRSPEWDAFVRQLVALPTRAARIDCIKAFARGRLTNWSGVSDREFGCFAFDPPQE
ncbi:MAG: hypothetical protein ACREXT_06870, partial [Gammaproteobacteria bacterium]